MKVTRKTFFCLILAFVMLLASITWLGSVSTENADATLQSDESNAEVYYFSDSEPAFSDEMTKSVYYDIHPLMTQQELAFLIYSGYFWGLNNTTITSVIIEIKTMKPDQYLIEQLFTCLEYQGLKVVFVCPYIYEMGYDMGTGDDIFTAMPYNCDRYSIFFDHSIRYMNDADIENTLSPSTIFIDGRFFGLTNIQGEYNLLDYWQSSVVRRIFYDIAYGKIDENTDKPIYEDLWNYYCQNDIIKNAGGCTLNYFNGDINIYAYIDLWTEIDDVLGFCRESYSKNYDYDGYEQLATFKKEMENAFKSAVGKYYAQIIENFSEEKIHVLAHVDGNEYIDLTKCKNPDSNTDYDYDYDFDLIDLSTNKSYFFPADVYHFSTVSGFYSVAAENNLNLQNVYAIAIWKLKTSFYKFLRAFQGYRYDLKPSMDLPVFVWLVDPFVDEGGLKVILNDTIINYYDDNLPYYEDEEELKKAFKSIQQKL
jgi:hypothetical protein